MSKKQQVDERKARYDKRRVMKDQGMVEVEERHRIHQEELLAVPIPSLELREVGESINIPRIINYGNQEDRSLYPTLNPEELKSYSLGVYGKENMFDFIDTSKSNARSSNQLLGILHTNVDVRQPNGSTASKTFFFEVVSGHDIVVKSLEPIQSEEGITLKTTRNVGVTFAHLATQLDTLAAKMVKDNRHVDIQKSMSQIGQDIINIASGVQPTGIYTETEIGSLVEFAAVIRVDKGRGIIIDGDERKYATTPYIDSVVKNSSCTFEDRFGGGDPRYIGTGNPELVKLSNNPEYYLIPEVTHERLDWAKVRINNSGPERLKVVGTAIWNLRNDERALRVLKAELNNPFVIDDSGYVSDIEKSSVLSVKGFRKNEFEDKNIHNPPNHNVDNISHANKLQLNLKDITEQKLKLDNLSNAESVVLYGQHIEREDGKGIIINHANKEYNLIYDNGQDSKGYILKDNHTNEIIGIIAHERMESIKMAHARQAMPSDELQMNPSPHEANQEQQLLSPKRPLGNSASPNRRNSKKTTNIVGSYINTLETVSTEHEPVSGNLTPGRTPFNRSRSNSRGSISP